MEMADAIAINKSDGDNIKRSELAKREYQNALYMFPPNESGWYPKVLTCSAINNKGIIEIWELICEHEATMKAKGFFKSNRQEQNLQWMHDTINYHLRNSFYNNEHVKKSLPYLEQQVETEKMPALIAAKRLLDLYRKSK
jgi:LAO/AO transport system kinase